MCDVKWIRRTDFGLTTLPCFWARLALVAMTSGEGAVSLKAGESLPLIMKTLKPLIFGMVPNV